MSFIQEKDDKKYKQEKKQMIKQRKAAQIEELVTPEG